MGKSNELRLSDAEAVFQLVSECREKWADADAWQMHLIQGACRLTGTAVGHYSEQRLAPDLQSTQMLDEIDFGWRDAAAGACHVRMFTDHADRTAFFPKCTQLAGRALEGLEASATRPRFNSDREWYRSSLFNDYRRPAYIDGFVMSFALNRQTGSVIMVMTSQDLADSPPTPRASAVISLLTRQLAPLVGTALATHRQYGLRKLSPRLRETLEALLTGESEKQVARRLGLHPTTVHDYIGMVYRHFHVTSRGELMAYFLGRRPLPPVGSPSAASCLVRAH